MPFFIKLDDSERILLFRKIKENKKNSWEKFYPQYSISRTMFFNYLSGRYDIPKTLFTKWSKIAKIKFVNLKQSYKEKYVQKTLPKIRLDNKLAEIFGVLNGDGHISKCGKEICIVCNSHEKKYLNYLKKILEQKFKIPFTFFYEPTRIKLRVYSKQLSALLTEKYGLPKGNKIGKLKIPPSIKYSKKLLICYLRGLFDTDGTFFIRRKKDPVIEISSADNAFLIEVKNILFSLNLKVGITKKHLYIYDKENIKRFFKTIRPANNKHLKKYTEYKSITNARMV